MVAAVWRLVGLGLASGGRLQAAAGCYRRALRAAPGHGGITADLAACLAGLREPQAALELCAAARESGVDDPVLYNNLGRLHALQGDHISAVAHFGQALRAAPRFGPAWANLGASLLALGRPRLALAAYRRAVSLAPGLHGSHWGEAVCLERLGQTSRAAAAYDRALGKK